jgi:hypothetical protein
MSDTVLHGRYGAASRLSERECTKDQEMVAVQGSARCTPHLQSNLIYHNPSKNEFLCVMISVWVKLPLIFTEFWI